MGPKKFDEANKDFFINSDEFSSCNDPAKEFENTQTVEITITTIQDGNENITAPIPETIGSKKSPESIIVFSVYFDSNHILETKWENGFKCKLDFDYNLNNPHDRAIIIDRPLLFVLRDLSVKAPKVTDPLASPDIRAGGTVDMLPLILGETEIHITVRLISVITGQVFNGMKVIVDAVSSGTPSETTQVPLTITMVSAHCLPTGKDLFYLAAIGLDEFVEPRAVNFGLAISSSDAKKIVWAAISTGQSIANSAYNVPNDDKFIPPGIQVKNPPCNSVYWNAFRRVLIDPSTLHKKLSRTWYFEVAGVPKSGKLDPKNRYMGMLDVGVLLQPGQESVTTVAYLQSFSEEDLPEDVQPVLDFPPASARGGRPPSPTDDLGHNSYVVVRFDVIEPLVPKLELVNLYATVGFIPQGPHTLQDIFYDEILPEDQLTVDVRKIRKEGGALAIHNELSSLSCKGTVPMNQSIKRNAANKLMLRVRTMLKQFAPGNCSYLDWQDTVTAQHAATRRAVTASFEPQPHPAKMSDPITAARCRMANDMRIADHHVNFNLEIKPNHPRSLIAKAIRCLESDNSLEAKKYVLRALKSQVQNRFLLWIYGGIEYNKGKKRAAVAEAALLIASAGADHSDSTSNAIGWAALHAFYHFNDNIPAAFVAIKNMRKSYEIQGDWVKFIKRWYEISGEEEAYWNPKVVSSVNPLLIASAFFLCLRCYSFSERILQCFENDCITRGSRLNLRTTITPDIYYLRASSSILRVEIDKATAFIDAGVKMFGPSPLLTQLSATSQMVKRGWDGECQAAFENAEDAGPSAVNPALLLRAALNGFQKNPEVALQRAARAHKEAPSPQTAFMIGRIYAKMGDLKTAERWIAVSVNIEPLLADGWAMLAVLQVRLYRDVPRARALLRTALQAGPLSHDVDAEVEKTRHKYEIETLTDKMTRDLCFCNYHTG